MDIKSCSTPWSIDIAFFGRMSASSDKGTGSEYVVDAASQFAHAISVNRADVENDYYAAGDDCDNTSGAGMIGETGYLSATSTAPLRRREPAEP